MKAVRSERGAVLVPFTSTIA